MMPGATRSLIIMSVALIICFISELFNFIIIFMNEHNFFLRMNIPVTRIYYVCNMTYIGRLIDKFSIIDILRYG